MRRYDIDKSIENIGDVLEESKDGKYGLIQDFKDETAKLLEQNKIMREALDGIKESFSFERCNRLAHNALNKIGE